MCNFAFVLIHLVHLIFLLLWDKPNIHVEQNCFFSKKKKEKKWKDKWFVWVLYKYMYGCILFWKTHTALGIYLFLFIFSVLFIMRNEIFQGAKTEWSFTWMHQVLMNKIWTLGGTNQLFFTACLSLVHLPWFKFFSFHWFFSGRRARELSGGFWVLSGGRRSVKDGR